MVKALENLGIRVVVLTSDNPVVTCNICEEVGISVHRVHTGLVVDQMNDDRLTAIIPFQLVVRYGIQLLFPDATDKGLVYQAVQYLDVKMNILISTEKYSGIASEKNIVPVPARKHFGRYAISRFNTIPGQHHIGFPLCQQGSFRK